jgi:hypothetical protein
MFGALGSPTAYAMGRLATQRSAGRRIIMVVLGRRHQDIEGEIW